MTTKEKVKEAERQTDTNPTEGQKVGGNYKKGKVVIKGFKISIENPIGSMRSGVDNNGREWSIKMKNTYGYFNGTVGKDGDQIDLYIGPIVDKDFDVYIIDQVDEDTRAFDEHKVMFGFKDINSAKKAYLNNFTRDWTGFDHITTLSIEKFRQWVNNKDAIKYPAYKLNMKQKIDLKNRDPGDRVHIIDLYGEVLENFTLEDLKRQAGDIEKFDTLIVRIASPGGSVSEGLNIMLWFESLSKKDKEIITVVTANAYSIASLIMLAADYKIISSTGRVMVHNPMVPELEYVNASALEKYAKELRQLESVMYELYQNFTGLKKEEIKRLMDNETYLEPKQAVKNGFADVILDIKPKSYEMTINNNKKVNMSKTFNVLNKIIGMVNGSEFINQLYYTSDGGEVQIFQKSPAAYNIGDRTSIENASVKLASTGAKLVIKNYLIDSIDNTVDSEGPAPKKILTKDAEAKVVDEETVVGEIKTEAKVVETEDPSKEKEEPKVEMKKEDGTKPDVKVENKEVVDTETKEKAAEETPVEIPEEKAIEVPKEASNLIEALSKQIEDLKSVVEEIKNKQMKMSKFEEVATEAIEALAKNTTSNFKPEAKNKVEASKGGSIFQRMKEKRGLN